jgi:hypothetical protein
VGAAPDRARRSAERPRRDLAQVSRALAFAHDRSVVHRDKRTKIDARAT